MWCPFILSQKCLPLSGAKVNAYALLNVFAASYGMVARNSSELPPLAIIGSHLEIHTVLLLRFMTRYIV
jgi:hypothetical protein